MRQRTINSQGSTRGFYLESTPFMSYDEFYELCAMPTDFLIQYLVPKHCFFTYISRQFKHVGAENEAARQFILRFKDGNIADTKDAARFVCEYLESEGLVGDEYTFVCVAASSPSAHELRYRTFMELVSSRTKVQNGFDLVNVNASRKQVHCGGSRCIKNYSCSTELAGRKVILFDDVHTTGQSFACFAADLERQGCEVIQGIFLAQADEPHS